MKKIVIAALLAATCALSTTASAAVVAMDGSFASNLNNKTYDAVFSAKSLLPDNYTVNSLSFSFSFLDNGGTLKNLGTKQTAYDASAYKLHSSSWFTDIYLRNVKATNTTTFASEQETASLSFGDLVLGQGATNYVESSKDKGSKTTRVVDSERCVVFWCEYKKSDVTTKSVELTKDYSGAFTISGVTTDQSIIDQLLGNGELALSLNIFGKLKLTGSEVLLDYTKVEAPTEEPGEVPEPSSVLLAGAGLAAIGFLRRRRSAAQA
ncbi:PEP-CTERM sorting domain-containing protein [Massilia oculi]|uniref:PEP-CTERM sorting domain-containing protein n=1 Tax=Massilia oculi TaxID=945844 RepID=UPI0028A751E8|nr:PEP-CTERM sorting domain-containing protein [Massilia oculi]